MVSRASPLRACAVLAATGSFAALAHAQTAVAGRVIHRAKQTPVPSVVVELLGVRDTVLATGISTQDGTFILAAPAGGTYRVRLTAPGAQAFMSDSVKVADDEYFARAFAIDPEPRAFLDIQVDRPVVAIAGSVKYPDDLRRHLRTGCVFAQFVVDTTGRADMTTFRIVKASDPEFAHAVRVGVATVRFRPAELHGQKVRQVVEQPFTFTIRGETHIAVESIVRRSPPSALSSVLPLPLPTICKTDR